MLGDAAKAAGDAIRFAGLVVGTLHTRTDTNCEEVFTVISQSRSAGTHVAPGSSVDFTYSVSPKNGCGIPN